MLINLYGWDYGMCDNQLKSISWEKEFIVNHIYGFM